MNDSFKKCDRKEQLMTMENFFKYFVWLCFFGLVVYTFYYWKDSEKIDKNVFLIRKFWYLAYLLGALIYWSFNTTSIFTEWKNYLIVVALFVCVDAFLFLNLYLRKAGTYEVERLTQTVSQNDNLIEENLTMAKNMLDFLNTEEIIGYYDSNEDYIFGLNQVLNNYASKEDMSVDLFRFVTDEEKREFLSSYPNKGSIKSRLDRGETVYGEKYALQPIGLFEGEAYLLKISGERQINEMNCTLFGVLIIMYGFLKPTKSNEDGGGDAS